jgi:type IV secretory pathway VirB4 component
MSVNAHSTQDFVPIEDIRDGVILMKDGSLKAIILATSINFALKSEDERIAILAQFQDLLNSLDFSIQIHAESRRLDIRPYLALLENQKKDQLNDLMKIQIQEYIGFIKAFTEDTNIMTKNFFIVVPYVPAVIQTKKGGFVDKIIPSKLSVQVGTTDESFEEHRTQLEQRLSVVEQGLLRCGIRVAKLGTEEVTELFYKIFNPGDLEKPMQLKS